MYEIIIEILKKRIGVTNKLRKLLENSYETSSPKSWYSLSEVPCFKAGSGKEIGINFEIKESEEN